jgi:hypothetical protein
LLIWHQITITHTLLANHIYCNVLMVLCDIQSYHL